MGYTTYKGIAMGSVGEFLAYNNLLPHGHCLFWRPDLLMLHVVSDALIALAYFSIPLTLIELLRRRKDLVFNHIFLMFAAFILACGLTHVLNIADIWLALYPASGLMKAFTAIISLITAVTCWKLLPAAESLPSPSQLADEVSRRVEAEQELRSINYDLEQRVAERTDEINQINQQLRQEIIEREHAQDRAEFLAAVVHYSDDSIVRIDLDGLVQSWNAGAEKLYGYSEQEMLGQHISKLFPPDAPELKQVIEDNQSPTTDKRVTNEVVRVTKSGEYLHVLLTISPIKDQAGNITGYAGISRSIQERIENEQRLQASTEELLKANADLKDFVYIASHDLQEPLRLITSYLHILDEDYGDKFDEDGKRYLGYTLESADRLQHLILDLLGYSRLTTNTQPITECDSREVIKTALDDLQLAVNNKQAQIILADNLPLLRCDQTQLRLLFQNLISNSLKYCDDDVTPQINISATEAEHHFQFTIQDNGIGFDSKHSDRIFQVFRRLHARHKYEGTGIGLAICKKIVSRHGGEIWAESEVGKGSRFHFTLLKNPPQKSLADNNANENNSNG